MRGTAQKIPPLPFPRNIRGCSALRAQAMENTVKISALGAATLLFVAPFGEFAGECGEAGDRGSKRNWRMSVPKIFLWLESEHGGF